MKWRKLGLIYRNPGLNADLTSHVSNPLPIHLEGDVYRVFFSGRDANNKSSVGAVDIDISSMRVVQEHAKTFFRHGPPGSFYADGVSIGNVYRVQDRMFILFMAWQTEGLDHWRGDVGRLELIEKDSLTLVPEAPFLCPDGESDPCSLSYPWVDHLSDGRYVMYYGSTIVWKSENGEMIHVINQAVSNDAERWTRLGLAVPYELGEAQAFSRPAVYRLADGLWRMNYSYRSGDGTKYRIGYAESLDGLNWIRKDHSAGITVSKEGWDSEMVCYPYVFENNGNWYMLYNGNGFGKSGFGLAVLEES